MLVEKSNMDHLIFALKAAGLLASTEPLKLWMRLYVVLWSMLLGLSGLLLEVRQRPDLYGVRQVLLKRCRSGAVFLSWTWTPRL